MLLIIFLGLIAKLTLGSDECDLGTPKMEDFDCNKVGISVWHIFYNKQLLKFIIGFIIHLLLH